MSLVRGENVLLAEFTGGVWILYGCARTCTLNTSTELVETSVTGAGRDATYKPGKRGWSGSLSGLVSLEQVNLLSLPDLREKERNGDEGPFDGMNTFSIEFVGTGPITQAYTDVTTGIMRHEYTGIAGELFFIETDLIGKTVFEVVKDGVGSSRIITSGTPVNKEVKFVTATGRIEFAIGIEEYEEVYVLYY